MKLSILPSLIIPLSLLSSSAFAQSDEIPSPTPAPSVSTTSDNSDLVTRALAANPFERTSFGPLFMESPESTKLLDDWIENAPIDHPKSIYFIDILSKTPPSFSGPRILSLAKKSADPSLQPVWARWLKQFPDAYTDTLLKWLSLASSNPAHFLSLLYDLNEINPQKALAVWIDLIKINFPSSLESVYSFGLPSPNCADTILSTLDPSADSVHTLRLLHTLIKCHTPASPESSTSTLQQILHNQIASPTIAVRMNALSVLASPIIPTSAQSPFLDQMLDRYNNAPNTTERAAALAALQRIQAPNQNSRLITSLTKGDDTLRFQAASLIAQSTYLPCPIDFIKDAFQTESWPDTQQKLYETLARFLPSNEEKSSFMISILLDKNRPIPMRQSALKDLASLDPSKLSIQTMNTLQDDEAPLDLIAAAAEFLYDSSPDSRAFLRKWLVAQLPFERRTLTTFAHFIRSDSHRKDTSSHDTMLNICQNALEQQNILIPCIHYLSDHAQSDQDKSLLESLQKRHHQIDAMTSLEF